MIRKTTDFIQGPAKKHMFQHTQTRNAFPFLQTSCGRVTNTPCSHASEWRLLDWSGQREILVGDSVAPVSSKPQ